ncbi:MAG: branched-chain amino acid aminotransferase [Sarcina sp.]
MDKNININWHNLGFNYTKTDFRYISTWKDGNWDNGFLSEDNKLTMSEGSPCLHYGQQCFEGLKAYRTANEEIQLFRVDENAKRMNKSARKLIMPEVPVEKFIDACMQVVKANKHFVPPYGTDATLYLRPFLIGTGDNIGVSPAKEYIFCVFCVPVGAYFKNGLSPANFMIANYDRAAPLGTGGDKVGGNYAASLTPHLIATKRGFADCIYLDPATHTKIEEVGAANFFGITKNNEFVTPKSPSILPSITKKSLMYIAKEYLKIPVFERDVFVNNLDDFKEAGACGTAAVITPIGAIEYKEKLHIFHSETQVGPIVKELYDTLHKIQFGEMTPPDGWIFKIN